MNKDKVRRVLKGLGLATLVAGIGLVSGGCKKEGSASCGKSSCGSKDAGTEKSSTSCGKGSCGT
ncbi:SbtA family thio(seleno)oxazole RiPP natural product precursor [bacterium]|nr:SbtA family thio(seleno)oxazole RiPP natural product precursor [bacterium]